MTRPLELLLIIVLIVLAAKITVWLCKDNNDNH